MKNLKKRVVRVFLGLFAFGLILLYQHFNQEQVIYEPVSVIRVIDGDTIEVLDSDGNKEKVRLIGVNTPETKHPTKGDEAFGKEAAQYTNQVLNGEKVYLEKDVSEFDKYNRLLRYVWIKIPDNPLNPSKKDLNAKLFNARLIQMGFAQVATYPPDVKYVELFLGLEKQAIKEKVGLWE